MELPIEAHTSVNPVINVGVAGAVLLSVKDLAVLFPQPETAITDNTKVDGAAGNLIVILLESAAFTLTSCAPVGKVQR